MAALMVINGQATVTLDMSNDELRRLMTAVSARLWAGEGFWATSVPDRSSGPKALWVPPGSLVQFHFDRGHMWDPMSMRRHGRRSMEDDETVVKKPAVRRHGRRSIEDDETVVKEG